MRLSISLEVERVKGSEGRGVEQGSFLREVGLGKGGKEGMNVVTP